MEMKANEIAQYAGEMYEKAKQQESGFWRAVGFVYGKKVEIECKEKNENFFYAILAAVEKEANNYGKPAPANNPTLTMPFQVLCSFYENKKVRLYTKINSDEDFVTGTIQSVTIKEILLNFTFTDGREISITLLHRIEILK